MTNETETRPILWGIWHMENGKATLCESDESMTVYYDCAFENEANAIAYAEKMNERWNENVAMHGWKGDAAYFAAPLPEGCKAEWIDGEESEYIGLETVEPMETSKEETAPVILPLDNLPKPEDFQIESEYLCALCEFGMSGVKLPESDDDSDSAIFLRWNYAVKEEFVLHHGANKWAQYQERLARESVELTETAKEETAPRRAFVFVRNYGDATQCRDLCDLINATTLYHAYLNDSGTPVIPCRIPELGDFLSRMAENEKTSWIEFSVQFEF